MVRLFWALSSLFLLGGCAGKEPPPAKPDEVGVINAVLGQGFEFGPDGYLKESRNVE